MESVKFYLALILGKIIAFVVNIISKEGGTNFPGKYAYKISKDFIKHFRGIDYNKVVFITGTNGKSTTNNMIVNALRTSGKTVTTNLAGANLLTGIATAMLKNSTLTGKIKTEYIVFETDERYLKQIYNQLPAKNICITNIQKDQVQRNGEPDYIYKKIETILNNDITLFVNNEEPRAKSLEDMGGKTICYGIEKNSKSFEKNDIYDVTLPCPKCSDKIKFDYYNIENVGNFECTNCGFSSEKDIRYIAKNINYEESTFECEGTKYTITYTQPFFIYNYVLCIALCKKFGISESEIQNSFKTFKNIGGRFECVKYHEKEIKYVRMKQENPETLQSALNYISGDKEQKIFLMGLSEVKDFNPYYANTFYTYDCNFKDLEDSNVEKYICFSKAVAYDSANRLIYAGIPREKIEIIPTENVEEVLKSLDRYYTNNVYLITLLKKFEEIQKYAKKEEARKEREELKEKKWKREF